MAQELTRQLSEYKVLSYDDLFSRYENGKLLLRELSSSFRTSFDSIKAVVAEHSNNDNSAFVSALSTVLESTQKSIGPLLNDPSSFKPTRLENQISEFHAEKSKGLDMIRGLQQTIESLKEEKRNWLLQKQ